MLSQPKETKSPFKDYYLILQLHPEADAAMVDAAYWHLARRYNEAGPDDPSAKTKLDDLNEAYSVIGSPARREDYHRARDAVLGEDALPALPPSEPERLPLTVMEKQRPRSREDATPPHPRRSQLSVRQVSIPPWQNALTAPIILVLASAALVSWAHPALVIAVLLIGAALTTLPLVRKLPRLPALPALAPRAPAVRAQHLPERRPAHITADPDALRQSTEAIRARWREGFDTEDVSSAALPELHSWPESPDTLDQQASRE